MIAPKRKREPRYGPKTTTLIETSWSNKYWPTQLLASFGWAAVYMLVWNKVIIDIIPSLHKITYWEMFVLYLIYILNVRNIFGNATSSKETRKEILP